MATQTRPKRQRLRNTLLVGAALTIAVALSTVPQLWGMMQASKPYYNTAEDENYIAALASAVNATKEKAPLISRQHGPSVLTEAEEETSLSRGDDTDSAADNGTTTRSKSNKQASSQQKKTPKKNKPLNIVLLYADDMRYDSVGYANRWKVVKTPFLDDFATKQGVYFTHNCVTTSICWISRATLHTGLYMARHKSQFLRNPSWYNIWNESFPHLLKQNGYHVGHIGKWHWVLDTKKHSHVVDTYDYMKRYEGYHWTKDRQSGKRMHITHQNQRDAMEFLKTRPKDKPFHMTVAFFAPKDIGPPVNWEPQNYSYHLYEGMTIPLAESATVRDWELLPNFFTEKNAGRTRFFERWGNSTVGGDDSKYQIMIKKYYRMISEVDDACRRIVEELEHQGVLNDTLVIFTTDNGYFQAEHGLAGKWYPFEESLRVPLLIRDPRMALEKRGSVLDDFTLNIDLAPTILSAAQIPVPVNMQGRDIAELYLGADGGVVTPPWRTEFYYEHLLKNFGKDFIPQSEALVRKDTKYILWPQHDKTEQLFHVKQDPLERKDLSQSPEYTQVLKEMRARFVELKAQAQ